MLKVVSWWLQTMNIPVIVSPSNISRLRHIPFFSLSENPRLLAISLCQASRYPRKLFCSHWKFHTRWCLYYKSYIQVLTFALQYGSWNGFLFSFPPKGLFTLRASKKRSIIRMNCRVSLVPSSFTNCSAEATVSLITYIKRGIKWDSSSQVCYYMHVHVPELQGRLSFWVRRQPQVVSC